MYLHNRLFEASYIKYKAVRFASRSDGYKKRQGRVGHTSLASMSLCPQLDTADLNERAFGGHIDGFMEVDAFRQRQS